MKKITITKIDGDTLTTYQVNTGLYEELINSAECVLEDGGCEKETVILAEMILRIFRR